MQALASLAKMPCTGQPSAEISQTKSISELFVCAFVYVQRHRRIENPNRVDLVVYCLLFQNSWRKISKVSFAKKIREGS